MDTNEAIERYFSLIKPERITPDNIDNWRAQFISMEYPSSIGIEFGEYNCTHRCRMCPQYFRNTENDRFITEKTLHSILDAIDPERGLNLELSAFGETLMHPEAVDFAILTKKRLPKARITLATNGCLLDPASGRRLLEAEIDQIQVSLNTGSKESYSWFCGREDYEKVVANLDRLVDLKSEIDSPSEIVTHIIGVWELSHEFGSFVERWEGRVDQVYIRGYGNWGGEVNGNGLTSLHSVPEQRYPCTSIFGSLEIMANGMAYKCYLHGLPGAENTGIVGDVLKEDIADIWKGEKLQMIRSQHLRGEYDKPPYCKDCIGWSLVPNIWKKNPIGPVPVWT